MTAATPASPIDGILGLVREMKVVEQAGCSSAAIAMAFICIDTMARLSLPLGVPAQKSSDFIEWVNAYVKADPSQTYQYDGRDVYGARCAFLHAYGSASDYHAKSPDVKKFGYTDGGKHITDENSELVLIGLPAFVDDITRAVERFLQDARGNADLRARVESRIASVMGTFPIPR